MSPLDCQAYRGHLRSDLRPRVEWVTLRLMATTVLRPELSVDTRSGVFDNLMATTYRKVYNMAFRLCGNRADAEDLTQEACFRAYRSFDKYEGNRPFENWIFRIVTRLYLDLLRNRHRRVKVVSYDSRPLQEFEEGPNFEFPDVQPNAETHLLESFFSEDVEAVLALLSEEECKLVTLADIDGIPYSELAEHFGCPVGTIRSRLHRVHKRIRRGLKHVRRGHMGADARERLAHSRAPY